MVLLQSAYTPQTLPPDDEIYDKTVKNTNNSLLSHKILFHIQFWLDDVLKNDCLPDRTRHCWLVLAKNPVGLSKEDELVSYFFLAFAEHKIKNIEFTVASNAQ